MKTCLIGKKLNYSFSNKIHSYLGDNSYSLVELDEEDLSAFVKSKNYNGFNVTNPYKETIINLLDEIDDDAKNVAAVNCVVLRDGKYIGYNTDVFGLEKTIENNDVIIKGQTVLILGSGGASKACRYLVEKLGGTPIIISREGKNNYQNIYEFNPSVIINATPVGNINHFDRLIDLKRFNNLKAVIDLTYNPISTKLLQDAKEIGVKAVNGLEMLVYQAIKANSLFFSKDNHANAKEIINQLLNKQRNIIMSGMSGVGKTTIGKALSQEINYKFIDVDEEIEKKYGLIEDIFKDKGEKEFRKIESEIVREYAFNNNYVISVGGGATTIKENVELLKANGIFVLVNRDLEKIDLSNRPLTNNLDEAKSLYLKRKDTYLKNADIIVDNNSDGIDLVVKRIIEML